jgi:hypothetical protein
MVILNEEDPLFITCSGHFASTETDGITWLNRQARTVRRGARVDVVGQRSGTNDVTVRFVGGIKDCWV